MSLRSDTKALPFYFLFFVGEKRFYHSKIFSLFSSRCQWGKIRANGRQRPSEETRGKFKKAPDERSSQESSKK